ncbi:hypothetical protein VTK56DRAFT_1965 [Thermocarpiscus australiensis]
MWAGMLIALPVTTCWTMVLSSAARFPLLSAASSICPRRIFFVVVDSSLSEPFHMWVEVSVELGALSAVDLHHCSLACNGTGSQALLGLSGEVTFGGGVPFDENWRRVNGVHSDKEGLTGHHRCEDSIGRPDVITEPSQIIDCDHLIAARNGRHVRTTPHRLFVPHVHQH